MSAFVSAINGSFAVGCRMEDGKLPANARFADAILIQYSLANLLDTENQSDVDLTFANGILFDLWLENGDGDVVWRFTQPDPGDPIVAKVKFGETFNIPIEEGDSIKISTDSDKHVPAIDLKSVIKDEGIPPTTELTVCFKPLHDTVSHVYRCLLWR